MAELNAFAYAAGRSILHRHDIRFKLGALALMTAACVGAQFSGLMVVSLVLTALAVHLRLPLAAFTAELRFLAIFLAFVLTARALTTPGEPLAAWGPLTVTREGLVQGALICGRLANIVLLGLIFVRSTRPAEIKAGVGWLLRPIPGIDAAQAAVMVGLIVRFIPVLHHQINQTRIAWRARGGERCKNPLVRIKYLVLPAMRRTVLTADDLALAMTARCFTPARTDPAFRTRRQDLAVLAGALVVLVLTMVI
jgi:energy-coupling factor transporter transmembrane protein EcfT